MPRPTAAQLAYGSCTVILSTLAMLLLSQTSSGLGITVIALAALALGLLIAMTVPLPGAREAAPADTAPATHPEATTATARATVSAGRQRAPERRETVPAGVQPGRRRTSGS
ncbi:hypothetical protein ACF061_32645 [Streptomyces sp. NPDC015220]|uniref:hypothetical protein n=1 Tax=Streptomyces sp. NPDC015220 TaxID=3364947 RepID=UPI0036FB536B